MLHILSFFIKAFICYIKEGSTYVSIFVCFLQNHDYKDFSKGADLLTLVAEDCVILISACGLVDTGWEGRITVYTLCYRKPVKFFENRSNMCSAWGFSYDSSSVVLYFLELIGCTFLKTIRMDLAYKQFAKQRYLHLWEAQ